MPTKLVAAAAVTAALATGGIAGAMLGTPSLSSAQTPAPTATTATTAPAAPDPGRPPAEAFPGLDVAASTIGISVDDLRTALQGGQTIAAVATAHGVEPQAVIDALVAAATDGLTDRITAFVNGDGGGGGGGGGRTGPWSGGADGTGPAAGPFGGFGAGGFGGFGGGMPIVEQELSVVASTIGIDVDALHTALAGGQSIADIAAAHGVDRQAVIDAVVADATTRIDGVVDAGGGDGRLTQEQADRITSSLPTIVGRLVDGQLPTPSSGVPGRFGGRGGWGGGPGTARPDPSTAPTAPATPPTTG